MRLYARYGKRIVDVMFSLVSLIALSPLMFVTAVLIVVEDGWPVLFAQSRVGRFGRRFRILKFRSMPVSTPDVSSDQARSLRVTSTGAVIRRTSIDELPQLVNILFGEMSFVGPRPALGTQDRLIQLRAESGALDCVPGLTGLAQIRAYEGMSVDAKAALDGEYAKLITFWGDVKIVLGTVRYLFQSPPVY